MASAGRILIMPKGDWSADAAYEMLDLVVRNGVSWIAKKESEGIEPGTNSEYWQSVSRMMSVEYKNIQVECEGGETAYTISIGHSDDNILGVIHWLGEPVSWDFTKANLYQKNNTEGTISTDKPNTFIVHYIVFYQQK